MKTTLTAIALATTLAQPASAVTFPALTTIYIGSGVRDSANGPNSGLATIVHCSNVSGVAAAVRMQLLHANGTSAGGHTFSSIAHGSTVTVATHATAAYAATNLNVLEINSGVVNIESTQSGVFCNAAVIDASGSVVVAVPIPLVRVNPHPGTVE